MFFLLKVTSQTWQGLSTQLVYLHWYIKLPNYYLSHNLIVF